jgi:isocitrate dehydrogenase (NAD+)
VSHDVVFIPGGGIGVDLETAVKRIVQAAGVDVRWEVFAAGLPARDRGKPSLPPEMLTAVRRSGVALKTKILWPPDEPGPNLNVQLRRELGLFAAVRPLRNLRGLPAHFKDVDILLIREITEDLYGSIEHEIIPGVVQSLKVVTAGACRRFFRFALDLARREGRRTVHCIHKANILKLADGLFLEICRETARDFPELELREMIVDNCCMQLVSNPGRFDVLVAGNLYGDLLSDLGAGLVGGISATLGVNHGPGIRVYEAIHGDTLEAIGRDRANPLPIVSPALAMLRDLGETRAADRILLAVETVLSDGQVRTRDLGGSAGTRDMTEAIVAAL